MKVIVYRASLEHIQTPEDSELTHLPYRSVANGEVDDF